MISVIYTKSLDNADDIDVRVSQHEDRRSAISEFQKIVNDLVQETLDNEFFKTKISIHNYKALIRIEDVHYVIAIQ